jgi:hypothetical protein
MTTILDEHFITQKQLLTRLRLLLQNKTDILIPKNQAFAVEVVQRYSKVSEVGVEVESVHVDVNSLSGFPELCMHVFFKDGTTITVSNRNVARAAMSTKDADAVAVRRPIDTKNELLRTVVQPDIQAFKTKAYESKSPLLCALCRRCLIDEKRKNVHVDHFGPNTEFRHLVEQFKIEQKCPSILEIDARGFARFHASTAKLQILCARCNLQKERPV